MPVIPRKRAQPTENQNLIEFRQDEGLRSKMREQQRPLPPVLKPWVLVTICPSPDKGRCCLEASRNGRCHQSWGLGYHLPFSGQWSFVSGGERERPSRAVLCVLLTICPSPDKGRWCPEASRNGRRHQSWGLGYHLPLSGQGSLVSGVEQKRPSPPVFVPHSPERPETSFLFGQPTSQPHFDATHPSGGLARTGRWDEC